MPSAQALRDTNRLRDHIISTYRDVKMPGIGQIFDRADERGSGEIRRSHVSETEEFRALFGGRTWQSLTCLEALNISMATLNKDAYHYYVQAQLLCDNPDELLGLSPFQIGLTSVDAVLRDRVDEFSRAFGELKSGCLGLYVQIYALHDETERRDIYSQAFRDFWHSYARPQSFFSG